MIMMTETIIMIPVIASKNRGSFAFSGVSTGIDNDDANTCTGEGVSFLFLPI